MSETPVPSASEATPVVDATTSVAPSRPRPKKPAQGRVFRRTSYRRALLEGALIYAAFRLLQMVPLDWLSGAAVIVLILLLLVLRFLPPVWAASRVVSTKREKMSARFWKMGPLLAGLCLLVDMTVALGLGEPIFPAGPDGYGPVWVRLQPGAAHPLSLDAFALDETKTFFFLLIYFTIAVICTRLANGGFLRFTMPGGDGRVTL
jgi:hypothetical protein